MKKMLLLICLTGYLFSGCTREDLTVQIVRNPLIQFTVDSTTWKAESYDISGPANVVVYPSNPALPGVIYNRYFLQATGKDNKGNNLQFNLVFDAVNPARLTGTYRVGYTADKGLQQAQLFTLDGSLSAFAFCSNDTITPVLQIQKQSETERLISGTFQMTLCNTRDATKKVIIKNGIITDIRY